MELKEKQIAAIIESNALMVNTMLAIQAKMTAITNIYALFMESATNKKTTKEEIHGMFDQAFKIEIERLRKEYQKKIDHITGELRGE
jgi:hypothetical protein